MQVGFREKPADAEDDSGVANLVNGHTGAFAEAWAEKFLSFEAYGFFGSTCHGEA
jgi:hypothetical protein